METRSGDSTAKEPVEVREKRWPLAEVVFTGPTRIPGSTTMMTCLEAGATRLVDGKEWHAPPMWYDPVNRIISISDVSYPMERVHCFRRAKVAFAKKPPKLDLDKYNVGKR